MCGIAGWVDFERDLTNERATAQAMTDTMINRGPDAEGLWLSPRAAMGHRRLSIIDLEGGRQPMVAEENGKPVAVLIYTGEVYNFRELRAELKGRGHAFLTSSDTEVVLRAYQHWGVACVERLNGMFAFAIWDVRREELLLVRDRLGVKPLYFSPTPAGVLFGSEPKAILANPLVRAEVDNQGLRELLAFVKTPGMAVYKRDARGATRPHRARGPRGRARAVLLEAGGQAAHGRSPDDDPHHPRVAGRHRHPAAHLGCAAVLAALRGPGLQRHHRAGGQVAARAGRGAGALVLGGLRGPDGELQAGRDADTPDAPYIIEVAKLVGSRHRTSSSPPRSWRIPACAPRCCGARDLPHGMGDMDASLYLLFRAIRQHSTVALSGESADEVFGGYAWFHDPAAVAADTFPWIAMILSRYRQNGSMTAPTFLKPGMIKGLELEAYREARYREALAEVPRLDGETGQERRMREVCYLHLTRLLQMLLDRKDRMSMATGLEVRVPFCDHRLVEYVFNTPWSMKTFDGREKSLLRAATADLLPRSVVERRKSPYPSTQDPKYAHELQRQVAGVLANDNAPVNALIDVDKARAATRTPDSTTDMIARMGYEQVLLLNGWLERYDVRLPA